MKYIIPLFIIFVSTTGAQLLTSTDYIQFPFTSSGSTDSLNFTVTNLYQEEITIDLFRHYSARFTFSDSLFTLPAGGEIIITVYYSPFDNVIDNDLLIYGSSSDGATLAVSVSGSGRYDDMYQNPTFNLYDNALKTALYGLVNNHTALGYNLARDKMYMEIDNKKVNGQGAPVNTLECVYTGREAVGYIDRTDCQNNYGFNTEHTWPQSFFGSAEPMVSDLFHLFPTDATANNIRGNLHFGRVVSNIDWQVGGSKRGKDSLSETVFEPRDVHKGNIARSLFYFTVHYNNPGGFLDQKQEDLFRIWNHTDPADTIEKKRNADIAFYQQKRNPFIDHPEFIDRIYSFRTNQERPRNPLLEVLPQELLFDSTNTGDTGRVPVYILNEGNGGMNISSVQTDPPFYISGYPDTLGFLSMQKINVNFIPQSQGTYTGSLIVFTSGSTDTIYLSGYGTGIISDIRNESEKPSAFALYQNYPNPFNPSTVIKYEIPKAEYAVLKVYDVLGTEVATLVNGQKNQGVYQIQFDSGGLSSGIYFYKLTAGGYTSVRKMIIVK